VRRCQSNTPVARFLTTVEAAAVAKVVPKTIRNWIDQGKLPCHGAGRELRVRRADLERLMSRPRSRGESPEALAARDFGIARK
jgi:excisionase family DNA binding protein